MGHFSPEWLGHVDRILHIAYKIILEGYDGSGIEIVSTKMNLDGHISDPFLADDSSPAIREKFWICAGPWFAWKIQRYLLPTGVTFRLEYAHTTTPLGDEVIFYEYIKQSYFSQQISAQYTEDGFWADWYGVYDAALMIPNSPNSPFETVPNDESYSNYQGYPILDDEFVYRVKKSMGYWDTYGYDTLLMQGDLVGTGTYGDANTNDAADLNYMVTWFNENSNIQLFSEDFYNEDLYCQSYFDPIENLDGMGCDPPAIDVDYNDDGVWNGLDWLYYYVNECDDGGFTNPIPNPWEELSMIAVKNISDPSISRSMVSHNDIFDDNGNFIPPNFPVNIGLNKVDIIFKGGINRSFVFEATEPIINNWALSNLLDVSIFPVPIQNNSFTINLVANANMEVTYELFDFNGNYNI